MIENLKRTLLCDWLHIHERITIKKGTGHYFNLGWHNTPTNAVVDACKRCTAILKMYVA